MNVPKLRFKEFNKNWKAIKLSDLLSFNNGINTDKDNYGYGRKFINVLDILNNNSIEYEDIIGSVSVTPKIEEGNKVEYGDMLFLRSSETREDVGRSSVYLDNEKYALFGGFVIRGKKEKDYYPYFLKLNLESPKVRKQIGSKAGGSTRINVSQSVLKSVQINMPVTEEQTRIAAFFKRLDHKVKTQQDKVRLLKKEKKGLMQKIFNKELRFKDKDGINFPEWRTKKLEEVFSERNEKGNEEFELLSITLEEGVIRRSEIESKDNSNPDKSKYKIVKKNDIAYNSMRMWQGASGISKYEGIVSPAYTVLIPKEETSSLFFSYLFKFEKNVYEFRRYSQGLTSDTWNLKYRQLKDIKMEVPFLKEQNKIGLFLTVFDQKIESEYEKLKKLKKQKEGFLQKMFI